MTVPIPSWFPPPDPASAFDADTLAVLWARLVVEVGREQASRCWLSWVAATDASAT